MATFIYTRVSTTQQVGGMSLDAQVQACKGYLSTLHAQGKWSNDGGLQILNEQVSGSVAFTKRERGRELLDKLQRGDTLVVAKLDRAWRSAQDCLACIEQFKKRGVSLHLVDMGGDVCNGISQLVVTIMSAVAQWERERIGERTRDAKREQLRKGLYSGGKLPWDKKLVDGRVVDDEAKRDSVRRLREWRKKGITLRECQRRLAKRNVRISFDAIKRLTDEVRHELATKRGRRASR